MASQTNITRISDDRINNIDIDQGEKIKIIISIKTFPKQPQDTILIKLKLLKVTST